MNPMTKLPLAAALLCLCSLAQAEKADRDKPVNMEADRITVDDVNKVHILEGNVVLTKGTMIIRTDKLVVSQDANGFQKSIAYGGPGGLARYRQKREASPDYVDGEAIRIEHDDRAEKTDFYERAYLKSGRDEVKGQFISYDGRAENYIVTNGGKTAKSGDGRVRAVIQPRNAPAETKP